MTASDNISRFPHSGPRSYAPAEPLTEAELAARRTDFLDRWTAALANARAGLADEVRTITGKRRGSE